MKGRRFFLLARAAVIQLSLCIVLSRASLAQEWEARQVRGTVRVVDLWQPSVSVMLNYAEGLVTLDKDNNWVPCLARDWRWMDDQTIEFKLRRGVTFHNGEEFNAEAVRINWEAYRRMTNPRVVTLTNLPDEAEFVDRVDVITQSIPQFTGTAFKKRYFDARAHLEILDEDENEG